jgi:hypothetical protein
MVATDSDRLEVVLCLVDNELLAAPTRYLEQIIEYLVHPSAPCSSEWIGGTAVFGGAVLPSLSFASAGATVMRANEPARLAKGLLFKVDKRRFVIEIERVTTLAQARVVGASLFRTWRAHCPTTWLVDAATSEKEVIPLLNVTAVADSLGN